METINLDISKNTKFEESRTQKGLQKVARKSDQNWKKDGIGKLGEEVGDTR